MSLPPVCTNRKHTTYIKFCTVHVQKKPCGVALHCKASIIIIIIISILPMQPSGAALPAVFTSERATRRHMNARAFYLVLGRCCIQFGYFAASGRCGFPSPWKRHGSLPDGFFLKTKLCSRCSVFCYSKEKHAKIAG